MYNESIISGKFKDEMGGKSIEEFVGLRSKMYSINTSDGKVKKTAKGILTVVKEKNITHEMYKECIFTKKQMIHKMTRIINQEHQLYTVEQNKTSLSPFNDKKWIKRVDSDFTSYSFGHYKIEKEEDNELQDNLSDIISEANM